MIINLAMKSHRFPKIPLLLVTTTCVFAVTCLASDKGKKAPPAKPANQYAAFDPHPNEKVTIAAEPCDDPKDCDFFRLPYVQHGFIPIRVIITNDGDTALSLDDARIQFISANNDKIPAATDDDIQRRLFSAKSIKGRKCLFPRLCLPSISTTSRSTSRSPRTTTTSASPAPSSTPTPPSQATSSTTSASSTTHPLKGAELFVKMVHTLDGKKQLFDFNIPFDKWLAAQSSQKPADKPDDAAPKP